MAIGLTDPVFRDHSKRKHGKAVDEDMDAAVAEWTHFVFPGLSHSFEDVKFFQQHWKGPIVLKGIQSVEDAKKCVEIGVQGIVVRGACIGREDVPNWKALHLWSRSRW